MISALSSILQLIDRQVSLRFVVCQVDGLCRLCGKLARLILNLINAALNVRQLQPANVAGELLRTLGELGQGGERHGCGDLIGS